ncbi:MAG: TrkH family potassium uptake protein, partial [Rhodospirillales bacterium]|nr:TrkH family potassium uptake protein [Rhodospirillales bacterium]
MIDFRPVLVVVGTILSALALAMLLPAGMAAIDGKPDWLVFMASAAITAFVGMAMVLSNHTGRRDLTVRQAFLTTALAWVAVGGFGSLPFMFSTVGLGFTDAFFETISGITTTGATVMVNLDDASRAILLWRALLQWLGGIGIVVMAVTMLPMLKIGGMQMFRMEGVEPSEKAMPRAARITSLISMLYVVLTVLLCFLLWWAGMSGFNALTHAMTTISTGGFSNSDYSVASFHSALVEVLITVGMVVGGMPFMLFPQLLQRRWRILLADNQLRWYLGIILLATLVIALWLIMGGRHGILDALRYSAFTVASFITGSGFYTTDYVSWADLPLALLFFLTFVGGCAGSTASGIKIFRFHILLANARVQTTK